MSKPIEAAQESFNRLARREEPIPEDTAIAFVHYLAQVFEAADKMHGILLPRVEKLVASDPDRGSPWGEELRKLAPIVEAYEKLRWPVIQHERDCYQAKGLWTCTRDCPVTVRTSDDFSPRKENE